MRAAAPATLSIVALAALTAGCAGPGLRFSPPPGPIARPRAPATETYRVVVVGDTQQMAPVDWVMRGGPKERALVRARIEALAPDLVLHCGDVVGYGASRSQWEDFRHEYASVPIWPVIGNHDLAGSNETALASFFEAFPHVEGRRWYALRHPPLAILMLDSNLGDLGDEAVLEQRTWLAAELDRAQADPKVRGIVLVTHHPPLSRMIGGGNSRVREAFYDEAAKRSKFTAFLSGHHHSYQHIEHAGRHAFVTGGGGAPLLLLECGGLPDGARLLESRVAHHVLELRVRADGIGAVVHELSPDRRSWSEGAETVIPWPGAPAQGAGPAASLR